MAPSNPTTMTTIDAAFVERTNTLARSYRSGDAQAYDELSRLLHDRLERVGRRITGDEQEGQDIAQEALVKGFRSIDGWDGSGSFAGWIYTIATRCAIDHRRHSAREAGRVDGYRNEQEDERAGAKQPSPLQESIGEERREQVRRALAELTDNQRVTVVLRHFEGMSLAEIAALRGCSVGTVKATLFQAFTRLRDKLITLG